ncbi:MAG TPA: VCBS repeat-containing protein [Solirubrobacter sp.]|nr:VCBS repeat-containing protein [Solirubrobacter sp.]
MRRVAIAFLVLALWPSAARADFNGDGPADVLAARPDGRLMLYRGDGASGWITGHGEQIGTGFNGFSSLLAAGDFSGDGNPDLIVRSGEQLLLYRGNGSGGWATGVGQLIGSGFGPFTALLTPGDFSGDGYPDLLARQSNGVLLMYRGDGDGGWITGHGEQIGVGFESFNALLAAGDFSGDGKPDVIGRHPDGRLMLYRGNGAGHWVTGRGEQIGTGFAPFKALVAGGDFSGDHEPDLLAVYPDGRMMLYRGNGSGGWITGHGEQIGTGFAAFDHLVLFGTSPPPPPPPPAPSAPPSAPLPDGKVSLTAGLRCTPPGGRLRVSLKVRRRPGRAAPRVKRVVFFVRKGPRKVDRRRPYVVRLRMNRPAGYRGRVYARVYYRRDGSKKIHRKTVSRRFVMCG